MLNNRNSWARLEIINPVLHPLNTWFALLVGGLILAVWALIAAATPDTLAGEVYKKSYRLPRTTTTWQTTYGAKGQPTGGFPITTNHPEKWLVFIIDEEGTTEDFAIPQIVWEGVEVGDWFNSETMGVGR